VGEVGIALIGCGGMGRAEARLVPGLAGASLVGCYDVVAEAAEAFAQEMGVRAYAELEKVLQDPAVAAVIVATPNATHAEIAVRAATAGKHVFCEKPMALSVADCDAMARAAEEHGVRLMVGQVLRLMPLFQRVAELWEGGRLGRPVSAQLTRIGWLSVPAGAYRAQRALTGGLLYEVTVHEIDFLHRVLGPTVEVAAWMDTFVHGGVVDYEDTVHLLMRHRGGASSHVFAAVSSTLDVYRGVVVGTQGTLEFHHRWREGEIRLRPAGGEAETERVSGGEDAYRKELQSFVDWIRLGTPPVLTWREGRAAVAVAEAAYRSRAQGGVPVPVG
jgi:predicted dehydrogenase